MTNLLEIIRQVEDMRVSRGGYCGIDFKDVDGYRKDLRMSIGPEIAETLKLKFPMIIKLKLTERVPKKSEPFSYNIDHIKIMGFEERKIKKHKAKGQIAKSTQYIYYVAGGNIVADLHFSGCIISDTELPVELHASYFIEIEQVFQE